MQHYEIPNKKISIIDIGLTNSMSSVLNFDVLKSTFGTSCQTCHKLVRLTLETRGRIASKSAIPKVKRFKHFSYENLIQVKDYIWSKLKDLEEIRALGGRTFQLTYQAICKLYFNAKIKFLGLREPNKRNRNLSSKVRSLQLKIKEATRSFNRHKTEASLFKLQTLETVLAKRYYFEKTYEYSKWLRTLNKHDFKKRSEFFCGITY